MLVKVHPALIFYDFVSGRAVRGDFCPEMF